MEFRLDEARAMLARTPALMRTWLAELQPAWTDANEGEGTWTPFDVVGHLIDGEETDWIVRAKIILGYGEVRAFEPYDRFRHLERNRGRTLISLLDEFASLRAANLDTLDGFRLTPQDLTRRGTHPELGTVTLSQLLAAWVAHDLDHVVQVARVMALRYRHDAGPWPQYLRILRPVPR